MWRRIQSQTQERHDFGVDGQQRPRLGSSSDPRGLNVAFFSLTPLAGSTHTRTEISTHASPVHGRCQASSSSLQQPRESLMTAGCEAPLGVAQSHVRHGRYPHGKASSGRARISSLIYGALTCSGGGSYGALTCSGGARQRCLKISKVMTGASAGSSAAAASSMHFTCKAHHAWLSSSAEMLLLLSTGHSNACTAPSPVLFNLCQTLHMKY